MKFLFELQQTEEMLLIKVINQLLMVEHLNLFNHRKAAPEINKLNCLGVIQN